MGKFINLTGVKFGKLTAIKRADDINGRTAWVCECECGNVRIVSRDSLKRNEKNISCGCGRLKHGHTTKDSSEYRSWNSMIQRCENKNNRNYKNYGARGIKVCGRWKEFKNFLGDMGTKPTPQHSIDRIDVNGDYKPSNCRWATRTEQSLNKRLDERNKTGVTGVCFEKQTQKYVASLTINRKTYKSKRFSEFEEAVRARKELEQKYLKSLQ